MKQNRGFTLVEMSIVIVIISLIIGGVVAGKAMIRNAEINSVAKESESFIRAIKNFQDKYQALPGDFSRASSYWDGLNNGNGNSSVRDVEGFYAWTHLASAGFVEGSFTGAVGDQGGAYDRMPGTNVPRSQVAGGGWGFLHINKDVIDASEHALWYENGYPIPEHVLWLGGRSSTGDDSETANVLTPAEAYLIDVKLDDGLSVTGSVLAQYNTNSSATQCSDVDGGIYQASTAGLYCSLAFKTGF